MGFFMQFADDIIYASAYVYLRDMQLLGARAHNFLLFRSAMTRVVVLLQPRLEGTFMAS